MIKTIDMLLYEYRDYSNIYNKIAVEEKKDNLIKLKRGLYETNKDADPFTIANVLFSPSYISFETVLAYYGMIPERVYAIKSASFKKKELLDLLFEDLRIDEVIFAQLDKCKLIELCDLYPSKTLHLLKKYLKK